MTSFFAHIVFVSCKNIVGIKNNKKIKVFIKQKIVK